MRNQSLPMPCQALVFCNLLGIYSASKAPHVAIELCAEPARRNHPCAAAAGLCSWPTQREPGLPGAGLARVLRERFIQGLALSCRPRSAADGSKPGVPGCRAPRALLLRASRGSSAGAPAASPGRPDATLAAELEPGKLRQPVCWVGTGTGQVGFSRDPPCSPGILRVLPGSSMFSWDPQCSPGILSVLPGSSGFSWDPQRSWFRTSQSCVAIRQHRANFTVCSSAAGLVFYVSR